MEEATRKATIGAVEIILKRQKLTITEKDVGVRLIDQSDIDSVFSEERLAGTAFYVLLLRDLICCHVKPCHWVAISCAAATALQPVTAPGTTSSSMAMSDATSLLSAYPTAPSVPAA